MTKHPQTVRQHLLAAALDGTPAIERVQAARIMLEPRGATGRRHHSCPVVGYLLPPGEDRLIVADPAAADLSRAGRPSGEA